MATSLYRMIQRRGTASQWSTANPILAVGEIGVAYDANVIKVGDGTTAWNSLTSIADKALPVQTSNSGKFLTTNGTAASWATVDLSTKQDKVTDVSDAEIGYLNGVTSAIQTQLNNKAPLASPALTGTPTAPTATAGTNTTQVATTAFVSTAVSNLIDSAPGALDTLNELAAAINDDASFASTVTTALGNKQDKVTNVSDTEIGYLDGVTSSIQTQINAKSGLLAAEPSANTNTASSVGHIGMPQVLLASGGLTLSKAHAGEHIYVTGSSQTITIPDNSSVPFEIGTTIAIINANLTSSIAITTDTLRLAGTATTGTRTLAAYGIATIVKVEATTWIASGNGLT
jgi:hypothetical protein